jgi:hypothetical protein
MRIDTYPARLPENCSLDPLRRRTTAAVFMAGLLAIASGCSFGTVSPEIHKVDSVMVVPDFSRLTPDGKTCEGKAPRPCVQPIYKAPRLTRPLTLGVFMNKLSSDNSDFVWPKESYGNGPGDALEVVCQVSGEERKNSLGQTSSVWNVSRVPANQVNQQTLNEAASPKPIFGAQKDNTGRVVYVFGFTPAIWTAHPGVLTELSRCTTLQDPHGYPPAA